MATYFVRKSGDDSNAGTSAGAAWLTIQKALTLANGVVGGDFIYIGAGIYRELVTITLAPSSLVSVIADNDGAFTGDSGVIRIVGNTTSDYSTVANSTASAIKVNGKSNFLFQGLELIPGAAGTFSQPLDMASVSGSTNITVRKCSFPGQTSSAFSGNPIVITTTADVNANILIDSCMILVSGTNSVVVNVTKSAISDYDCGITFQNCFVWAPFNASAITFSTAGASTFFGGGIKVLNCYSTGVNAVRLANQLSTTYPCTLYGNVFLGAMSVSTNGNVIEDYNAFLGGGITRTNVPIGGNSMVTGMFQNTFINQTLLDGRVTRPWGMPVPDAPWQGMGTVSGNTMPPGTAADNATVGTIAWTSPSNASQFDGTTTTNVVTASAVSHYLKLTNFGFAIPGGATIFGIMVDVFRNKSAGSGVLADNSIKLVKAGTISGTDHAMTTTWPGSITLASYGNKAGGDLWGLALTPTDVNDSTFGVALSVKETGGASSATAAIDYVRMTVFFTSQVSSDLMGVDCCSGTSLFGAEGTATSGGAKTLTDTLAAFPGANALADYQLKIKSGTGSGQIKVIRSNTSTVLTVDGNWVTQPDNTSTYVAYRAPLGTSGMLTAGSTTTATDANAAWAVNQWVGFVFSVTNGTGSGQLAGIASNTATVLTFQGTSFGVPALTTGLDSTSVYSIYKGPATLGTVTNNTPGPMTTGNTGIKNTTVVHSGSSSLRLFGPGYHDLSLAVNPTATNISMYVRYDSEYAGPLPQMRILNGTECGLADVSATSTASVDVWQSLSLTVTPTSAGVVTVRLLNTSTCPTGSAYFDA